MRGVSRSFGEKGRGKCLLSACTVYIKPVSPSETVQILVKCAINNGANTSAHIIVLLDDGSCTRATIPLLGEGRVTRVVKT